MDYSFIFNCLRGVEFNCRLIFTTIKGLIVFWHQKRHQPIVLALNISSDFNRISRHNGSIYHGIGVLIMLVGSFAIENIILDYEAPSRPIPISIASALPAGLLRKYCSLAYPSILLEIH